ncbi:MAG: PAS domain S-box protein [Prolixibacteraceae bacterium]
MKNKIYRLFKSKALHVFIILFSVIFFVVAHKLYSDRKSGLKESIKNNLKAIAELKSEEIHTWLNERFSDANVLSHNSFYPEFSTFNNKNSVSFNQLKERLTIFQQHYQYENIILLDLEKNIILSTNDSLIEVSEAVKQRLNDKLPDKTDFKIYKSAENRKIILDFYCTILNTKNEKLGYLILRTDPEKFLYPTIARWPVDSKSAETILLERTGDSVRSLNNPRFLPDPALKPWFKIDQTINPGVNAILGGSQLYEGVDYRKVRVLSYWVPVQGTNWKMIAKVDIEELFEPLRYQAWAFGIVLSMLLLFLTSVLLLISNIFQKSHLKRLYEAEIERKLLVSHFEYLVKNANDIILLANDSGIIVEANDAAVKTYQIKKEELIGSPLSRLGEFGKWKSKNTSSKIYESIHYRSDGSTFPVEINEQIVEVEDKKFFQAIIRDISQRKAAQAELDKSANKYKTLFFDSSDAYLILRDGIFIECNKASEILLGGDRSAIIGKTPVMISPEYQPNGKNSEEYVLEVNDDAFKNKSTSFEWLITKVDGTNFLAQINLSAIDYEGLPSLFVTWKDITKIREAESQLRKLSSAVEQSPVSVVITNLDGNIEYANPSACRTTGYSIEELLGKNPRVLKSGETELDEYQKLWDNISNGYQWRGVFHNKRKNGELYWESSTISPIVDPSGKITHYLAVKEDITQSKENEQKILDLNAGLELKIEERTAQLSITNKELAEEIKERISIQEELITKSKELESFFNVALDLLCIANTSGQFIKVNKAWESILGYSAEELMNSFFLDFVHPDDKEETLNVMKQLSEQNPVINFVNRYRTKDGSYRFIEWHSAPSGDMIYAAARDITERKRKEDFELELLHLSMQLTGIRAEEIQQTVGLSLERIGNFTGSDRSFIFEIDPGRETFSNSWEWCKDQDNVQLNTEMNIPMNLFPMWWEQLRQGKPVVIPDIDDLPESWNSEKITLKPFGDKSILAIPMFSENNLIGYCGLATIKERKEFSNDEINLLTIWCGMLTNVINNLHVDLLLNQTRKNYETFFNTLDDFLWVLDKEGTIIHFNNTALVRLGYPLEELVGKSVLMVHPKERREEAKAMLGRLLSGSNEVFSIPLMTKSGQVIPVETKAIQGYWNGQPVIFKASKDISQIKLSEEKFSTAFQFNSAMMAISRFDDGIYVDVNSAFLEVLGYSREEVIGKSGKELGLFIDPDSRNKIIDDLSKDIPVRKIEVPIRTKTGEVKIVLMSADTISIGDTKCLLTVNIDISDRKKMEEQLKAAQEEANRANIAKSEFLSRMSHELRTPMNSILGFAQLLDMGELNPGQKKGLKHIMNSGKHLLDLINEVLEISRIEAGKLSLSPEPIQISGIIHEMMEIVWPLAKDKQLTLDLIGSNANQLYILADRQRLKQVLLNLINNAIKYNKPGGSVKLFTDLMPENDLGFAPIRISISDTGIGILPEKISRLFQPFERIGAEVTSTEGTGLGLAVVKKLISAMGGTVGVESVAGEGSTFWIELPQTIGQLEQFEKSEIHNEFNGSLKNKTGTILYIEDNLSNIELIEQILFSNCNHLRLISNMYGKEAVRMALEYKPNLILLDLNLPDMHGSEVLEQLRSNVETKDIPVVVISADATSQQPEKLLQKGAAGFLTKPLDIRELLNMFNKMIRN